MFSIHRREYFPNVLEYLSTPVLLEYLVSFRNLLSALKYSLRFLPNKNVSQNRLFFFILIF